MKSAKRAVVESHYESGIEKKHKFVLTSTQDGWKLDSVSYSYGKQDGWHNYYI